MQAEAGGRDAREQKGDLRQGFRPHARWYSRSVRSRLRFSLALGLAVLLGGWLMWTSLGGAQEEYAGPGELVPGTTYRLDAIVAAGAPADAAARAQSSEGLRFTVVDKENRAQRVEVLYRGSVPDTFKAGREIVVTGQLRGEVFEAERGSMIAKCPSKFSDRPEDAAQPA
jgi:cytochrome c-type biogenesis protein CcmE